MPQQDFKNDLRVIFAGFGGQGLLFAGKVVAYTGLIDDREVSWLPSYGPEMRGGTANCSVTIASEPIGSPLISTPNVLVAMNQPSLLKFQEDVQPGGLVLVDTSLVTRVPERDDIAVIGLSATELAEENGLKGLANIVLVGKMLKETDFCTLDTMEAAIRKAVPASKAKMVENNLKALQLGMNL